MGSSRYQRGLRRTRLASTALAIAGACVGVTSAATASRHNGDLPAWSPDGNHIAYVAPSQSVGGNGESASNRDFRVIVMMPSGVGRRVVASFDRTEYALELRWASSGRLIVSTGSAGALRSIDVTTGKTVELGASKVGPLSLAANETFVLSADGSRVAGTTDSPDANENLTPERRIPDVFAIRVMSASGGPSRVLPQPVHASDAYPSFSPNGTQVVFARSMLSHGRASGPPSLMLQSGNGGQARPLHIPGDRPVWSPNGRWIAFQHLVQGAAAGLLVPWTLQVVRPSGGARRTVLNSNVDEALALSWSPDSTRIAFITESGRMGTATLRGKATMFKLPRLSFDGGVPDTPPSWSPDGKTLVFAATPDANPFETDIYAIGANGRGLRRIR